METSQLGKKATFGEYEDCEEILAKESYVGNYLEGANAFTSKICSVCEEYVGDEELRSPSYWTVIANEIL
jgi:hypothetical protein